MAVTNRAVTNATMAIARANIIAAKKNGAPTPSLAGAPHRAVRARALDDAVLVELRDFVSRVAEFAQDFVGVLAPPGRARDDLGGRAA